MARDLRLILVTPERTLLDEPVRSITLPLFDGMAGVFPGRAPMVGRLGYGTMTVYDHSGEARHFFLDGGFVQVADDTASVLTNRALKKGEVDAPEASEKLAEATMRITRGEQEYEARAKDQARYRGMKAFAAKAK
ncbi:FoF1 ATP synthase subunit delta/epsilon [Stratiformator vulcanicus]|uniref:ATP synthase epsilon chain n=1 Tax=Stratiformator vulcanicus TaxID=2527980 RepID=A0A517R1F3_9PLAN|nr:F0F1 ATP synthase subunit epsilon [Stratiformator vulcanicus]QDT37735.1 ATP synthase epsilon chain [Stratiformator vulcanicus]